MKTHFPDRDINNQTLAQQITFETMRPQMKSFKSDENKHETSSKILRSFILQSAHGRAVW